MVERRSPFRRLWVQVLVPLPNKEFSVSAGIPILCIQLIFGVIRYLRDSVIQSSRNASVVRVEPMLAMGMTVSAAPVFSAKANMVSSEVRLSCSPYKMRVRNAP